MPMKLKRISAWFGLMVMIAACHPALAQPAPGANGRWWPASGDAFAFGNPFAALYARGGLGVDIGAFGRPGGDTCGLFGGCPPIIAGLGAADGEPSFAMLAAIGARLAPVLRVEFSAGIGPMTAVRTDGVASGQPSRFDARVRSMQFMGSVFVDFAPWLGGALGGINPYVMGGAGIAVNSLNGARETLGSGLVPPQPATFFYPAGQSANFAWQAGTGVQWQAGNFLILDLGYAYLDAGRARSGGGAINCTVAPGPAIILCIPPSDGARVQVPVRAHRVMLSVIVPFDGLAGIGR